MTSTSAVRCDRWQTILDWQVAGLVSSEHTSEACLSDRRTRRSLCPPTGLLWRVRNWVQSFRPFGCSQRHLTLSRLSPWNAPTVGRVGRACIPRLGLGEGGEVPLVARPSSQVTQQCRPHRDRLQRASLYPSFLNSSIKAVSRSSLSLLTSAHNDTPTERSGAVS